MMSRIEDFEVIILGAGMAGASLAAELAGQRRLLLLEAEDLDSRHATGRSAAMYFESYGNPTIRALTRASRSFLLNPPTGFVDQPLMTRRDGLIVAAIDKLSKLDDWTARPATATLQRLNATEVRALVPVLRAGWVGGGVLDRTGHDLDVAALHQAYLRRARRAGARVLLGAGEAHIARVAGAWRVHSRAGEFVAPLIVNATGAWADLVAERAGAQQVGLQPLRRTLVTIDAPPGQDIRDWPMVIGADEDFYFKPDAGQLLLSPANEDPMPPCDVAPDELDVALAVDRFERATTLVVQRVIRRWAGLRSFVVYRTPVVGFDAQAEGFFWLAGQGGYGIQTAPAMARAAAALLMGQSLATDLIAEGVDVAALSPLRSALRHAVP